MEFCGRNLSNAMGGKTSKSADEFAEHGRKLSLSTLLLVVPSDSLLPPILLKICNHRP
jgi:hypothetical protein